MSYYDTEKSENKGVGMNGEMVLNEGAERAYLFEHNWRQVKKKFYREDLQGVEWDKYKAEYERYLPYINNNHDMAELCSELLGELNASHTGAGYGGDDVPNADATAVLGLLYANYRLVILNPDDYDGQIDAATKAVGFFTQFKQKGGPPDRIKDAGERIDDLNKLIQTFKEIKALPPEPPAEETPPPAPAPAPGAP